MHTVEKRRRSQQTAGQLFMKYHVFMEPNYPLLYQKKIHS
jgi:hypothetical protein